MNIFLAILPLAFIQNLGGWEVFAIVMVILLLFGGKKLPELARGAGKAIREFKKISTETEETFKRAMNEDEPEATAKKPAAPTPPATSTETQKTPPPPIEVSEAASQQASPPASDSTEATKK